MKDAFSTAALNDGLPSNNGNIANAEKELGTHFKAAALSIATLYKSSLASSKQAFGAGYLACLKDTQTFMHAGVSIQGQAQERGSPADSDGLTIGRVMDWVEARLEALKDVEEDEEDDKERESPQIPRAAPPGPVSSASRGTPRSDRKAQSHPPDREEQVRNERVHPTSANASPAMSRSISPPSHKSSGHRKDRGSVAHHPPHYPFELVLPNDSTVEFPLISHNGTSTSENSLTALAMSHINVPDVAVNVGIGSKRRFASLLDTPASSSRGPSQPSGGPRRRARNPRVTSTQHANSSISGPREHSNTSPVTGYEAMDVEERPRKSARR